MAEVLSTPDISRLLELHIHKVVCEAAEDAKAIVEQEIKKHADAIALQVLKHYSVSERSEEIIITVKKEI